MARELHVVGSMATRLVLAEAAVAYEKASGIAVRAETIGGLDAERRVAAAEPFDIVVLAAAVIERLAAAGHVHREGSVDVARSGIAVAVRAGAQRPDISDGSAVRDAIAAARAVGYSTGPSGQYIVRLIERWGLSQQLASRMVMAPPGVPVAAFLARGEVDLGFQQLSELLEMPGIEILGPLPADIQETTVFRGAVCTASLRRDDAQALLAWLASPEAAATKRRYGMEP